MPEDSFSPERRDKRLPSREECLRMVDDSKYELPEGRKEHIMKVNKIMCTMGAKLREAGIEIDIDIIDRASLLHDITKVISSGDHAKDAADMVRREGWSERMAEAIELHRSGSVDQALESDNWETKILNYVDRRVDGKTARVITLNEWLELKGGTEEKRKIYQKYKEFEIELQGIVGEDVEQIFNI